MTKRTKSGSDSARRRVYIVEDHKVFREGLVQILSAEKDLVVCGQAGAAEQAMKGISRLQPELALVDINLPGKTGLELIKEVRAVNRKVKMLVVSNHDEALYADRVLRAGGDGYIMKQEDPEELINAIRDVLDGRIYVSEDVMETLSGAHGNGHAKTESHILDKLTDVELEILESLGRGKSNGEIARQLNLRVPKVAAHITQIQRKFKVKTTNALVRHAVCWIETGAI